MSKLVQLITGVICPVIFVVCVSDVITGTKLQCSGYRCQVAGST